MRPVGNPARTVVTAEDLPAVMPDPPWAGFPARERGQCNNPVVHDPHIWFRAHRTPAGTGFYLNCPGRIPRARVRWVASVQRWQVSYNWKRGTDTFITDTWAQDHANRETHRARAARRSRLERRR